MKKLFFSLTFIFFLNFAFGQAQIDSLLTRLRYLSRFPITEENKHGKFLSNLPIIKERADLMNQLAVKYRQVLPRKSLEYAQSSYQIALVLHDTKMEAEARNNIAGAFYYLAIYDKGLEYSSQAYLLSEKKHYRPLMAEASYIMGLCYQAAGKSDIALNQFNKALAIYTDERMRDNVYELLNIIGNVFETEKNYTKALEYYSKSLQAQQADGLHNPSALSLFNMGSVYENMKSYETAFENYQEALNVARQEGEKYNIAKALLSLGRLATKQGKLTKADDYLTSALELARSIEANELVKDAYEFMTDLYLAKKDYRQAYLYQKLHYELKELLFNNSTTEKINQIQNISQLEKKEKEIELLKKSSEIQELTIRQNRTFRFFYYLIAIFIIAFTILVAIRFIQAKQSNTVLHTQKVELETSLEKLKKAQREILELERRNTALSIAVTTNHELNQPLMILQGCVDMLKFSLTDLDPKQQDYLVKIDQALDRIANLLKKYRTAENISFADYTEDTKMAVYGEDTVNHKIDT